MMDWLMPLFGVMAFGLVLITAFVMLVVPGVVVFWLMVLRVLRVPKIVALWEKWELEFAPPKELVMLAKAAKRLDREQTELNSALLRLPAGSYERQSLSEELEAHKIPLNQNNYYLAQAVVKHLENLKELK